MMSAPAPSRHVGGFVEMLRAERNAADNTVHAYQRDLADFAGFLARRGAAIETADAPAIRAYLARLDRAGMAPRTAARRLSAIRQFYRFLIGEGVRPDDPVAVIDGPRQGRPLPKLLSEAEVGRLLAAARAIATADGLRLVALLELLYAAGLRVSELVALPVAAVMRDQRVLLVRGKGGKERMIPLHDAARGAITAWRAAT
jgi:integrase/recombinase XerD